MRTNIFLISIVSAIILIISIIFFLNELQSNKLPLKKEKLQAIVVLTGGAKRIDTAVQLLQEGYGERLFISGVSDKFSRADFNRIIASHSQIITKNIILDTRSTTTKENVENTAQWITENNISSIYLVTEQFHLPRALLEFRHKIPLLKIVPWPVYHYNINKKLSDENSDIFNIIFKEYCKFYGAIIILTLEKIFNWKANK